jgi:hypothetical protein
MIQMKSLTLLVDERELSTIKAALLLLQEQVHALPEDLVEMLREHGPPMTESDIYDLSSRLGRPPDRYGVQFDGQRTQVEAFVEVERAFGPVFISK